MLTLKKNILKYKDSSGEMKDLNAVIGQETSDTTLTKSGIGADSKIVGDRFSELENRLDNYYLKTEADTLHSELHDYVDAEVAALVGAAPETLNTIEELATAFEENAEVVEVLNQAITGKADNTDVVAIEDRTTALEEKVGEGFEEITEAEIDTIFAEVFGE